MLTRATKYFKPGLTLLALAMLLLALPASATPGANRQPVAAPITAAPVSVELCANENTATMPDGAPINIWGFSICTDSLSIVTSPGPTLHVNAGDIVTVTLRNNLDTVNYTENVSLVFPGQAYPILTDGVLAPPDTVGVASGGSRTYEFTVTSGTFLYESGTNVGIQIPMGLYGALVVHATTCTTLPCAYDDSTAYDVESTLVLSEFDVDLNNLADPNTFDLLNYHPEYWLINGRAYPDTLLPNGDPSRPNQPVTSAISAAAGQRVLIRYLNPGLLHHTMQLLGTHQSVIARDGSPLFDAFSAIAETIPSGQTTDVIVTVPASGSYPLYNRQMHLTNGPITSSPHAPGGMMTFITVP